MSIWDCLKNKDGRPKTEVWKYGNPEITNELRYELEKLFAILDTVIVYHGIEMYTPTLDIKKRVEWYSENISKVLVPYHRRGREPPRVTELDYNKLKCRFERSRAQVIMLRKRGRYNGFALGKAIDTIRARENEIRRLQTVITDLNTQNRDLKESLEEESASVEELKGEISRLETENMVLREGKERVVIIRELPPRA